MNGLIRTRIVRESLKAARMGMERQRGYLCAGDGRGIYPGRTSGRRAGAVGMAELWAEKAGPPE